MSTIFVEVEKASICKRNGRIIVQDPEGKQVCDIPCEVPKAFVLTGNIRPASSFLNYAFRNNLPVVFLSLKGSFKGAISTCYSNNVFLRLEQYRKFTNERYSVKLSQSIISAKIYNGRVILQRQQRTHNTDMFDEIIEKLGVISDEVLSATSVDSIRGMEGKASRLYFDAFSLLFQDTPFKFTGRTFHPPRDEINAVMSFLYSMVFREFYCACILKGLDPYIGFFHSPTYSRPSLACDLMEPFRAFADGITLFIIRCNMLKPDDFTKSEDGVYLVKRGRKVVVEQFVNKVKLDNEENNQKSYRKIMYDEVEKLVNTLKKNEPFSPFRMK